MIIKKIKKMAKKVLFTVALIFATVSVARAQVRVEPVVNQFRSGNQYYLASASDTISVDAWIYQSAKTDRVVLVNGQFPAQKWTVSVSKKVLASANLSADEKSAVMTMTDGTTFQSSDMEWLKAIPGQPFILTEVNNSYTQKLWRNWTSMTAEKAASVKEMTAYAAPVQRAKPADQTATRTATTETAQTAARNTSAVSTQTTSRQEVIPVEQELSDEEIIALALQGGAKVQGTVRTRGHYLVTK